MKNSEKKHFDLIIIGAGPAGATAGIYALRSNNLTNKNNKIANNESFKILIIQNGKTALKKAEKIENYYGIYPSISGEELFENGINQLKNLGGEIIEQEVVSLAIDFDNTLYNSYIIKTNETEFKTDAVILTTGTNRMTPEIENLKELEGKGVSYCAICDGFFYRNKTVCVLGNSNYAKNEANELIQHAKKVYILTNGEEIDTDFDEKFEIITEKVERIIAKNNKVGSIEFKNKQSVETDGVFVALGTAGSVDFAKKIGMAIEKNKIIIDQKGKTSVEGIYAAGDCTGGMLQIAKAIYEGAIVGTNAIKYLRDLRKNIK